MSLRVPPGVDMRLNKGQSNFQAMAETKSSTVSRLQREADAADNLCRQLARNALLATDPRRRGQMILDASLLLREAEALREYAAEVEKQGFRFRRAFPILVHLATAVVGRGRTIFPMPRREALEPTSKMRSIDCSEYRPWI
jgi:hypothetical protein